ncbi:hypothetical protein GGI12_003676 [Dipsacomyces acuminosporus]|nr:hypothetical protein GGI12_003676 [Dipsacomyces acuminosporus]
MAPANNQYPASTHGRFSLDTARNRTAGTRIRGFHGHAHTTSDVTNAKAPPLQAQTTRIHRTYTTLPLDAAVISEPPVTDSLEAEPSAPPLLGSHMVSASNSSSSSGLSSLAHPRNEEPPFVRESPSLADEVRKVAIRDAQNQLNTKMFSDKVLNFRDIGVSAIKIGLKMDKPRAKAEHEGPMPGVVFRSAELGSAYEHDVKMLFSKYGIRTIIDLRSELEARASDILMRHYPSSIEPTANQSMDKLMKLRAAQVRNTIVEVAAHNYTSSAKPWERTGESQSSWTHRNSLRYTKSIGDPRKDPLARALAHLYDASSDYEGSEETEQVSLSHPYVPRYTPSIPPAPQPLHEAASAATLSHQSAPQRLASISEGDHGSTAIHAAHSIPEYHSSTLSPPVDGAYDAGHLQEVHFKLPSPSPPQRPAHSHEPVNGRSDGARAVEQDNPPQLKQPASIAQSALDWGSETLQYLRSYWDQQQASSPVANPVADGASAPLPATPNVNSSTAFSSANGQQESSIADDGSGNNSEDDASSASSDSDSDSDSDDAFDPAFATPSNAQVSQHGLRRISRISHSASHRLPAAANHLDAAKEGGADDGGSSSGMAMRATTEPPAHPDGKQSAISAAFTSGSTNMEGNRRSPGAPLPRIPRRVQRNAIVRQTIPADIGLSKYSVENRFGGGRRRYRCNVIGENYRKKCVWASAPWSTKLKVILRFATFNKAEAIRTIGREVLAPRGLAGSYEDYVDYCKEELASVLRIFADPCAYPILFHCQHGKDRTGIVAMLLLGILDVDDDIITEDYSLSQKNLEPVRSRMELLDMGAVGLPPSFCDSPAPVMRNLLRHIRKNYGSIRGYLRAGGLREQEINTIAWCLKGNFYSIVHAKNRIAHTEVRKMHSRLDGAQSDRLDSPSAENSRAEAFATAGSQ